MPCSFNTPTYNISLLFFSFFSFLFFSFFQNKILSIIEDIAYLLPMGDVMYVRMYIHTTDGTRMHACMYSEIYVHTCACMHADVHTSNDIHIYTYIHTHMQKLPWLLKTDCFEQKLLLLLQLSSTRQNVFESERFTYWSPIENTFLNQGDLAATVSPSSSSSLCKVGGKTQNSRYFLSLDGCRFREIT